MQTLGVLDVDGLDVGVQTLFGTLLVVTLARDADTQAEGNTLDTGLPDLLVELGVEADVLGALECTKPRSACALCGEGGAEVVRLTMACSAKARISLMARGARFLKLTPWHCIMKKKLQLVFRPNAIMRAKLCDVLVRP